MKLPDYIQNASPTVQRSYRKMVEGKEAEKQETARQIQMGRISPELFRHTVEAHTPPPGAPPSSAIQQERARVVEEGDKFDRIVQQHLPDLRSKGHGLKNVNITFTAVPKTPPPEVSA